MLPQVVLKEPENAKKLRINGLSYKELTNHPYFRDHHLVRVMLNYRDQHGPFNSIEDLKKILILNDSILDKWKAYLDFDEQHR